MGLKWDLRAGTAAVWFVAGCDPTAQEKVVLPGFFFYQGRGIFDSAPSELHFNPFLMLGRTISMIAELPNQVN